MTGLACALAWGVILFTRASGHTAAIWPLNALFLVLVLKTPPRQWAGLLAALLLGNTIANVLSGDPLITASLYGLANGIEVLIVALVMTRHRSARLLRKSSIVRFVGATLSACVVSTIIALATLAGSGTELALKEAAIWFAADTLGLLLFAPVIWVAMSGKGDRPIVTRAREMAPELGLLILATLAVFVQSRYPLLFLVPPAVVFLAIRRGLSGATTGLAAITLISLVFTLMGRGPTMLIDSDMPIRILVLQVFLAANALMGLSVGASSGERRQLIGRLKATKARISARSERERLLVDQARLAERMGQVGYWTLNPATGQIYWSPEVYRIHGVTRDTFNPELGDALKFYPDADRTMIAAEIERCLAIKTGWQFEADLRKQTGELIRVRSMAECRIGASGDVDMIFGVFKDITRDHAMLEQVKEQQALYQLLADNSSDVIARYGVDSIFTYLSPSIEGVLGYKPEELVGQSTTRVIHPGDHDHVQRTWGAGLKSGEPFSVEYRAIHRDGTILWLEARPTISRDETGKLVGFIDTVRDVTDRHHRELALAHATANAEAATRAKADFLSNMSHEIRTPLNGVLGFADLLANNDLSPEQRRYVDRIQMAGKSLLHVVNDVLDFSKIEAGMMTVEQLPFSPVDMVEDVVELVRAANPQAGLLMTSKIAIDVAPAYIGDDGRVRQILLNVIGNAAKFTVQGAINTDVSISGDQLCFTVTDTGPGIAPDRIESIFDGFSQADESITRKFGGSGLGLSISRSLARLMGGDVKVSSVQGQGTTVTLTLPAVAAPEGSVDKGNSTPLAAPASLKGLKILVVDDVEMNRELIAIGLGDAGHLVESHDSGEAAIEALKAGSVYDVILMDVQMPGMDGLAATRAIRDLPGAVADTPIIGLTANVLPEQISACRAAGMDDHFGKPVNMRRLVALIDQLGRQDPVESADEDDEIDYVNPALDALKANYLDHLKSLPDQLDELLRTEDPAARGKALADLAHSIGGTSGSFGLRGVSDAAFDLETAGRRAENQNGTLADLQPYVDRVSAEIALLAPEGPQRAPARSLRSVRSR